MEDYKKLGWKLGKLPLSEEEKKKIIRHPSHLATTKDRIAITNGKINKFVRKEDLDSFLISGEWRKGLTVKPFERTYIDDSFR